MLTRAYKKIRQFLFGDKSYPRDSAVRRVRVAITGPNGATVDFDGMLCDLHVLLEHLGRSTDYDYERRFFVLEEATDGS